MNESETFKKAAETLIQQPTIFKIEIVHPTPKEKILFALGLKKKYRTFVLKPLVLGKLFQISSILTSFDFVQLTKINQETLKAEAIRLIEAHIHDLVSIVAIAVSRRKVPSKKLKQFIMDNLSPIELLRAADIVVAKMEIQSFLSSIILLTGINILKQMSPQVQGEIIAPGNLSAAS